MINNMESEKIFYAQGFSGHGVSIAGSAGAVALGAIVVEKHVTLNKKMLGSDHAASLEFKEFKYLIDICKKIKISLGNSEKGFQKSEQILQNILLRKFVVSKNIHKNAYLNYVNRTNKNYEYQPFGRNIDLWMMGYCVAIKLELKPKPIETPTANAIPATAWSNNETLEHIVKLTLRNKQKNWSKTYNKVTKMILLESYLSLVSQNKLASDETFRKLLIEAI